MTGTTNWADEVGARIRAAREAHGWGRADLSMRVYAEQGVAVSHDTIGDMERGEKKQVDVGTLKLLADTLNVALIDLLPPGWGDDGGDSGDTIGGAIPGELDHPNMGLLSAA